MTAIAATQADQRARGVLRLEVRERAGSSRLAVLRQEGCLRACFPNAAGNGLQAILLNTGGGIADGDRLAVSLAAGPGATLVAASQAAERVYRARPGAEPAQVRVRIEVAAGGRVDYLPQETILFQDCALDRRLDVELTPDAVYLGVEILVFGRAASGEKLRGMTLRDTVRMRRGGRLVLQDSVRLDGEVARALSWPATAGGAGAVASLVYAAPDAADRLDDVRAALAAGGASVRDGVLVARSVAADGGTARRAIIAALGVLRGAMPLPRVWDC